MEHNELLIKKVIEEKFNQIVGGYENDLSDHGYKVPSSDEMKIEVYQEVMQAKVVSTKFGLVSVKKDIRFAGTENIKLWIDQRFQKEGY